MSQEIIQVRWHGRGGQGAITAAKIVANAAFQSGFRGVIMAPSFGTERRGAPINTSLKLAKEKINDISPIETPDMVVVLDHSLLEEEDVTAGLKPGGLLVLNTPKNLESYQLNGFRVAVADVTHIATQVGLRRGIVNTGIIGALAKASDLLKLETLLQHIELEFEGRRPKENAAAARKTYENTQVGVN